MNIRGTTIFYVEDGEAEEILKKAMARGYDATIRATSLEDLFIRLTGEKIEEGS
ncbi:MAG: hypothetical protein QW701_06045 [Candidatus Nezhaarchaeales archaeon]